MKFSKKDKKIYFLQYDNTYNLNYNFVIKNVKKVSEKIYKKKIKRFVIEANGKSGYKKEIVLLEENRINGNIIYLNIK